MRGLHQGKAAIWVARGPRGARECTLHQRRGPQKAMQLCGARSHWPLPALYGEHRAHWVGLEDARGCVSQAARHQTMQWSGNGAIRRRWNKVARLQQPRSAPQRTAAGGACKQSRGGCCGNHRRRMRGGYQSNRTQTRIRLGMRKFRRVAESGRRRGEVHGGIERLRPVHDRRCARRVAMEDRVRRYVRVVGRFQRVAVAVLRRLSATRDWETKGSTSHQNRRRR
eukprot:6213049-Pleurochrysis_carterae.AAC.1